MKASFLIEFKDEHECKQFENWLEFKGSNINSVTILPDTQNLYDNDPIFRAMIKKHKKDKKSINDYINKNK